MSTGTPSAAQSPLDAWKLVTSQPSRWPGCAVFVATDTGGRAGVLRLVERSHAGPDAGKAMVEAWQRVARLDDPRLVRPWASGTTRHNGKDTVYVVSPEVMGAPVAELLGALSPGEAAAMLAQAADVLAMAHSVGVAHGDLTGASMWLLPGRAVTVGDFACVTWVEGSPKPARSISSPELVNGGAGTFSGDVYALAVLGAAMICGAQAHAAWLNAQGAVDAAMVQTALGKAGAGKELIRVLLSGLHADPLGRPTAASLAGQLRPLASALPEVAQAEEAAARSATPTAVAAWLGEQSDPRAPAPGGAVPAPVVVPEPVPAPAAPTGNGAGAKTSGALPPLSGGAVGSAPDNRAASTLPPGVLSLSQAQDLGHPEEEEFNTTESQIIKMDSDDDGDATVESTIFTTTESQVVSMEAVSDPMLLPTAPAVSPPSGQVTINMTAATPLAGNGEAFPLVARWTERPGGKGRGPVEILQPARRGSGASVPTVVAGGGSRRGPHPALLMAAAAALGLFFGVGFGRLTAGGGAGPPGGLRVESTLDDVDVRVEVDGVARGLAPQAMDDLSPGPHVVVLKADSADPAVVSVQVESRQTSVVRSAPELYSSRLLVTSNRKGVLVTREGGEPVPVPADFDDVEPDTDVPLSFTVNGQVIRTTVHVPVGEGHFHLELPTKDTAAPGGQPPPPPPQATPPQPSRREARPRRGTPVRTEEPPPPPPPDPGAAPAAPAEPAGLSAAELLVLGRKALVAGQFQKAADYMNQALALDATLSEAVKSLGIVYARTGKNCDALRAYRKYLLMSPAATDGDRVRSIVSDLEEHAPDCPP